MLNVSNLSNFIEISLSTPKINKRYKILKKLIFSMFFNVLIRGGFSALFVYH